MKGDLIIKERNKSIDSLRFIAAICIVFLHYSSFNGLFGVFIKEISRFAVPFFFAVSGFFLTKKLIVNNSPKVYFYFIKKLVILSFLWNCIYVFCYAFIRFSNTWSFVFLDLGYIKSSFVGVLRGDASFHLWFFTSLYLTAFLYFLIGVKRIKFLLIIAVSLYVYGVIGRGYRYSAIGILVPFNTRDYIFFSSLPFFLGAFISLKKRNIGIKVSVLVFCIGFFLHLLERYLLKTFYRLDFSDYFFSTFLMGVGGLLVALNRPKFLESKRLSSLGKYSLGMYALHVIVFTFTRVFMEHITHEENRFVNLFVTIIVTIVIIKILYKIKYLQNVVKHLL